MFSRSTGLGVAVGSGVAAAGAAVASGAEEGAGVAVSGSDVGTAVCTGKAGARGLRSLVQTRVEGPLSTFLLTRTAAPAAVSGALVGEELVFSE